MIGPLVLHCARLSRWFLMACVFSVALSPLSARAQQSEDGVRAQLDLADEAEVLFELGVEAQRRADYLTALERYLASNRLVPNSNVAFNIARCYELLDRHAEAFRYYSDYLTGELSAEDRTLATAALDRLRTRVAILRVESDPPGATIFLDRRDLGARGRTPRELAVAPGTYTVIVEMNGHIGAQSEPTTVSTGRSGAVSLSLERVLGELRVVGEPAGAEIRLDDEESEVVGLIPATIPAVPGSHTVIVTAPGHTTVRSPTEVRARETTRVEVVLALETGSLVVDAEEAGALIEVDGEAAGFTPAVVPDVPSGRHRVRISRSGFRPYEEDVEVSPRERTTVAARLRLSSEVTAASRDAEALEDAPASVSLVSQDEIRAFGYQTVYDAVAGQRGVYQSYDLTYPSVGIRGFSQPSDYGNRVLTSVDGHTMNDDQLGSSYVGYDSRVDLLDVERIELVRGPGSTLYGTNAFFGVLNVVTRDRDSLMGPHASVATDGFRGARLSVGGGTRFSRSAGFWASAGGLWAQGDDHVFPELDASGASARGCNATPVGTGTSVQGCDGFYALNAAGRLWVDDFTLQFQFNRRDKNIPSAPFGSLVGDSRARAADSRGFLELRWTPTIVPEVRLFTRAFVDGYFYEGDFPYESADGGTVRDRWDGVWAGGEARATMTPTDWLRITAGAEGRGSLLGHLYSRNDDGQYLDRNAGFYVAAGYLTANVRPIREITVDLGARYDFVSTFRDGAFNPRAAIILRPWTGGNIKLLGGSAFRAPSPYELNYNDGGITQVAPVSLGAERIWTGELELTQRVDDTVLMLSGYYNRIENLITTETLPGMPDVFQYTNATDIAQTVGVEGEVRKELRQGWMIAATYAFQRTRVGNLGSDTAASRLTNSPEHLGSLRGIAPLIPEVLNLAARLRMESPRLSRRPSDGLLIESDIPVLADLILSGEIRQARISWQAGVRNLFDWRFGWPGGPDLAQSLITQPGRTFFVQTTVSY